MRNCIFLVLYPAVTFVASAQEQTGAAKPSTKIEAFQAKAGVVLVRGYTVTGSIHGLGGNISVDAREFRDAPIPQVV